MEARRPTTPSSETMRSAINAAPDQAALKDPSSNSKTKKVALPSQVILNAEQTLDTHVAPEKTEKDGWNIESLLGLAEKDTPEHESPEAGAEMPEVLDEEQTRHVVSEYIEDRHADIEAEQAETPDHSPLAQVIEANQTFLDALHQKVHETSSSADHALAEARETTIQQLQLNQESAAAEHPMTQTVPPAPRRATVRSQQQAIATILQSEQPAEADPELTVGNLDMPVAHDLAEEVHARHSTQRAIHEPIQTTVKSHGGEMTQTPAYTRADVTKGVIAGGVAGYLVGRHVGRKKAEASTAPKRAELSKQIEVLQKKIASNEQVIRELAAKKVAHEHAVQAKSQPAYNEAIQPARSKNEHVARSVAVPRNESLEVHAPAAVTSPPSERKPTPQSTEKAPDKPLVSPAPKQEQVIAVTPVEKLSKEDVLVLAKTIRVQGRTLESYYERGELTEKDVRIILTEQRKSGRAERAFFKQQSLREHGRLVQPTAKDTRQPNQITISPDAMHDDNTRHLGLAATLGAIILVIIAILLVRSMYS